MRNPLAAFNPNTQGILCLIGALGSLTISDSIIKWLSPDMALHQITLFRSVFALLAVMVFVQLEGGLVTLKTKRPVLHFLRGATLVLARQANSTICKKLSTVFFILYPVTGGAN